MIGYLVSRYGAGIKTYDYSDADKSLDLACAHAAIMLSHERERLPVIEEMTYSREAGWKNTGAFIRFYGPLKAER